MCFPRGKMSWATTLLSGDGAVRTLQTFWRSLDALVEALTTAEADDARCSIAYAMTSFAESEQGRTSLISGGACGALVEALKAADDIHATAASSCVLL